MNFVRIIVVVNGDQKEVHVGSVQAGKAQEKVVCPFGLILRVKQRSVRFFFLRRGILTKCHQGVGLRVVKTLEY